MATRMPLDRAGHIHRSRVCRSDESSHRLLEEYDLHAGNGSATTAQDLSADEQAWHARSVVGAALQRIKGVLVPLMFWAIRPALFVVLRGVVRMKSFWERGLKSSYFDTSKLSGDIVYYYRLPQVRGCAHQAVRCAALLQAQLPP